jgi:RNA polymerase sigma-70 factor (ECF subfamily)
MEMGDEAEQLADELLVMDCQSGRVEAMEALVSRWQKRLWSYARRLTGNPDAAWDVTQESWLGILRGIGRLRDPARFRPWVYRIVTRKADDWIAGSMKSRRRRTEMGHEEAEQTRQPDPEASDKLQRLMDKLPKESRTVLTLYYVEDLPIADVAVILDIPEGTVKSRLHTARNELKALWQREQEENDNER